MLFFYLFLACVLLLLFLSFVVSVLFGNLFIYIYILFCSRWSFVDAPLIFFCPAHHVSDWQPRILLGTVEARLVNVKKTTTTATSWIMSKLTRDGTAEPVSRGQSLRRVRGPRNLHFPCSANLKQDRQAHPVDSYSTICDDHTYTQQSKDGPDMVVNPALGEMTKEINVFPVHVRD